jgi:hypothetical protein
MDERSSEHSRINTHKRKALGKNDTVVKNKASDAAGLVQVRRPGVAGG